MERTVVPLGLHTENHFEKLYSVLCVVGNGWIEMTVFRFSVGSAIYCSIGNKRNVVEVFVSRADGPAVPRVLAHEYNLSERNQTARSSITASHAFSHVAFYHLKQHAYRSLELHAMVSSHGCETQCRHYWRH